MILGSDIFSEIKIYLCFSDTTIRGNGGAYEGCIVPTKDATTGERFHNKEIWDKKHVLDTTRRTRPILDSNYEKPDIRKFTA